MNEMTSYQIEHYLTPDEQKNLYLDGFKDLRSQQAKVAVIRRMNRIVQGNFGDHKFWRDGVGELRIDAGPDHRVYHAQHRVLLLGGGDKRTQDADIHRAVTC